MKKTDLTGKRFGQLTVIEDSGIRKHKSILWRCKCDCGGETLTTGSMLASGSVTNCGCVPKKRTIFGAAEDMTGRQFGELTVLHRVENGKQNQTRWLCQCSCGNLHTVSTNRLKSGNTQSCGCKRHRMFYGKDLTGQQFGRLTALYLVSAEKSGTTRNRVTWHCRCTCGNEIDVTADSLLSGNTQSCGCAPHEFNLKFVERLHYVEDTCLELLEGILSKETKSRSGFRGVYLTKKGTYQARISFQKKHYHLGTYKSFEKAVQARLEAESYLHSGFIKAYHKWLERAQSDPEWAEKNPLLYKVEKRNGKFHVVTNIVEAVSV